jgi:cation diffusion facilitator CzcD-associated flavoprotein CzcO
MRDALPGPVRVAVIGAGFGGLAVLHELRRAGIDDVLVLERAGQVGGTWRDNTYPGCACDVPSHAYSLSWAPNPGWTRSYSRQPEIQRYLTGVAARAGLQRHLALGVEVLDAAWDEPGARWRLDTGAGPLTADLLVAAAGPFSEPLIPRIPGLDSFDGPVLHTARWRDDVALAGRRIGVVGTGASAIQVVPELQPAAEHLTLFQRTPAWVLPRRDRAISPAERALFRRIPAAQRALRAGHFLAREALVPGFVRRPALLRPKESAARRHLARQVPDPALRAVLTPSYRLGCKRILFSNTYYPALTSPNVTVVGSALAGFESREAIAADGSRHLLDAVVFGTGFAVGDPPISRRLRGRDGRTLRQAWIAAGGGTALRATTVAGFPNLFLVLGPNSGLGHSSMVHIIESQAAYIADAIRATAAGRIAALEPRPEAQQAYDADVQRRMRRSVWSTGGCSSWYQGPDGRISALWPGGLPGFRARTRAVDLAEYRLRTLDPELAAARAGTPTPGAGR